MHETEMNGETMRLGLVAVTSRSLVTSRSTPWLHVAIGYLSAATHLGYFYMRCWGLYTCLFRHKVYWLGGANQTCLYTPSAHVFLLIFGQKGRFATHSLNVTHFADLPLLYLKRCHFDDFMPQIFTLTDWGAVKFRPLPRIYEIQITYTYIF